MADGTRNVESDIQRRWRRIWDAYMDRAARESSGAAVSMIVPKPLRDLARPFTRALRGYRRRAGVLADRILHGKPAVGRHPEVDEAKESVRKANLKAFLTDPAKRIQFPHAAAPLVTILIPSYNRAHQLYECLLSIIECTTGIPYELIVIDNASTDAAPDVLRRVDGANIILSKENLGFVRSNNAAAKQARGAYLMLLNNDTIVKPGWLAGLLATAETWPDCGAVGPRTLFDDGRLQEAGVIVYADGRVDQYGFGADADEDKYLHAREVDYVSGSCLLIRTEFYRKLGGFDDRYAPAYFEDVDLCFGVRSLGYKVVYQPASTIVHHGPSAASAEKTRDACAANHAKFVRKWKAVLAGHSMGRLPAALVMDAERRDGKRLLVIDEAGSPLPAARAKSGFVVTFCQTGLEVVDAAAAAALRKAGVEVMPGSCARIQELLRARPGFYNSCVFGNAAEAESILHTAGTPRDWPPVENGD